MVVLADNYQQHSETCFCSIRFIKPTTISKRWWFRTPGQVWWILSCCWWWWSFGYSAAPAGRGLGGAGGGGDGGYHTQSPPAADGPNAIANTGSGGGGADILQVPSQLQGLVVLVSFSLHIPPDK